MSATAFAFAHRHLLGIEALSAADIEQLLDLSETFLEISERPIKKVPTLRGRTVINLFLEASTRTRTSFEIAAKRLSADAVNISGSSSSTTKGETLLDTARNLNAMRPDVIVLRHAASGGAAQIARHVDGAVVNAGDGAIVMHPGPINRGVELDPALADSPRSVILDQVTRGVAVRMAILYLLGGGRQGE